MMAPLYYWNILREGQKPEAKNYLMNISTSRKFIAEEELEKWKKKYPGQHFHLVRTQTLDCTLMRPRRRR